MGRLLERLLCNSQSAPAAIPAIPAIRHRERGQGIAESQESQGGDVEKTRAHLLALAIAEGIDPAHVHRLHDDDLRAIPADYAEHNLVAYLRALQREVGMDAGFAPVDWQAVAHCAGCGPVYLWEPMKVTACPWCFRRKAGKPVPRPQVTCGNCRHYSPDTVSPDAGIGRCALGAARAYWPMKMHRCSDMRPVSQAISYSVAEGEQ